jgi:hypothetical protein
MDSLVLHPVISKRPAASAIYEGWNAACTVTGVLRTQIIDGIGGFERAEGWSRLLTQLDSGEDAQRYT